ncbi:succinate dehydrogenase, hydrophobic membrane anchor protein [Roseomonas chloroacetimidivorans]|jgi:succinate dehydrogenase / fumarate reductase membrane anchor subunit|uniref:succinate dehydrogenase, hydrophobic membrane anchor protein n=1 Tax=Roseomonas chloroacetimidivorans TaxID=1766656 RepID=UPI003C747071
MSDHQARLQTPLGRVRGFGSAKNGTHHWWMQRVTSIVMLPLVIWFTFSIAAHAGEPYEVMAEWIGRPFNAVLLLVLITIGFYHTASGLQVVVEDYVRPDRAVMAVNLAVKSILTLLGLLAALSVLRLAI